MVHVEPHEQAVASAEGEILDDLIDLRKRCCVIEIHEVRGEIHTADRLFRCEVDRLSVFYGCKSTETVEFRFAKEAAECGVQGAVIGGTEDRAVMLCGDHVAVVFERRIGNQRHGIAVAVAIKRDTAKREKALSAMAKNRKAVGMHLLLLKMEAFHGGVLSVDVQGSIAIIALKREDVKIFGIN